MPLDKRKHYYLIVGKVIIIDTESGEGSSRELNTLTIQQDNKFTRRSLALAQQAMQTRVVQEGDMTNKVIVDVVIFSVSHLGHMTEAEYNKGYEALEKAQNEASMAEIESLLKPKN